MNAEFTVDLIEQKGELLFVGGSSLSPLVSTAQSPLTFTTLLQDGKSAKSRRTLATVALTVETLIVDGEPGDTLAEGQAALIALRGDATPLLDAAQSLRWQVKGKRYLRTSAEALTLST